MFKLFPGDFIQIKHPTLTMGAETHESYCSICAAIKQQSAKEENMEIENLSKTNEHSFVYDPNKKQIISGTPNSSDNPITKLWEESVTGGNSSYKITPVFVSDSFPKEFVMSSKNYEEVKLEIGSWSWALYKLSRGERVSCNKFRDSGYGYFLEIDSWGDLNLIPIDEVSDIDNIGAIFDEFSPKEQTWYVVDIKMSKRQQ